MKGSQSALQSLPSLNEKSGTSKSGLLLAATGGFVLSYGIGAIASPLSDGFFRNAKALLFSFWNFSPSQTSWFSSSCGKFCRKLIFDKNQIFVRLFSNIFQPIIKRDTWQHGHSRKSYNGAKNWLQILSFAKLAQVPIQRIDVH